MMDIEKTRVQTPVLDASIGNITVKISPTPVLQEKMLTANGVFTADDGYDGLSKVTVSVPVPSGYIKPDGIKAITANGMHDVVSFESVIVNIPSETVDEYDGATETVITFKISERRRLLERSYQASEGMTFAEWYGSEHNTDWIDLQNEQEDSFDVMMPDKDGDVLAHRVYASINDVIEHGMTYTVEQID